MGDIYVRATDRDPLPAAPGACAALQLKTLRIDPPVVLAPMAGVTNAPFRTLCRGFGAGLATSEMITARALVQGEKKTLDLARFAPGEHPRSIQLYGVEPESLGEATRRLTGEGGVDHIDLNFGCPVRKVTSKGGGAAIPAKPRLLARLVRAAVAGAGEVPVTIKLRMGIDETLLTYREAGRVGENEGCAAVGLHARTAAQLYDGEARWEAIADLKRRIAIPVLGNGDIREAHDALRMMRETGCDGVIVGRGCLGRPWLFRELADLFAGREPAAPPCFGEVLDLLLEHARRVCDWVGERRGMLMMRKFVSDYTRAFPGGAALRASLARVKSLEELRAGLQGCDRSLPFPEAGLRARRGKRSGRQKVALPPGYLDDPEDDTPPGAAAELGVSGG